MARQAPSTQQQDFSKDYQKVHPLFFIAIGIGIGFAIGVLVTNAQENPLLGFVGGLTPENVAPELLGLVLTYGIIEIVLRNNEQKREEAKLKARLIRQMGSSINSEAIRAVEELRAHNWLYDTSINNEYLQGANLQGANLSDINFDQAILAHAILEGANLTNTNLTRANLANANLKNANLRRSKLILANLEDANLSRANFKGARLVRTNLKGANLENAFFQLAFCVQPILEYANLKGANLERTNLAKVNLKNCTLEGANLMGVDLKETNLRNVNLKNAKIKGAMFNEKTILPDGTNWTHGTDLLRFTDPDHPDFRESFFQEELSLEQLMSLRKMIQQEVNAQLK